MIKNILLIVLVLVLYVGVHIFWGWILSVILGMFGVNITTLHGFLITSFIGFIGSNFKTYGKN